MFCFAIIIAWLKNILIYALIWCLATDNTTPFLDVDRLLGNGRMEETITSGLDRMGLGG